MFNTVAVMWIHMPIRHHNCDGPTREAIGTLRRSTGHEIKGKEMMDNAYEDFLKRKAVSDPMTGLIDVPELPECLFPHNPLSAARLIPEKIDR